MLETDIEEESFPEKVEERGNELFIRMIYEEGQRTFILDAYGCIDEIIGNI